MKRIALLIATNLAVMIVLGVLISVLGVGRVSTATGLNMGNLLVLSILVGFTGAFISLLMSKWMAKFSTGARVIDPQNPKNETERWLVNQVHQLADAAHLGHPEVAVYEGEPNAFATGAFKNSALVAVSTGLLTGMTKDEVRAVLAHEVAHIQNGDMVTMTLIQGVMNTFVYMFARIVGYIVDKRLNPDGSGNGIASMITSIVFQIVFGILASIIVMWFSRQREFRADAGAAKLLGAPDAMISALRRLGGMEPGELPKNMAAAGIADKSAIMAMFSSHPSIEDRIRALQKTA